MKQELKDLLFDKLKKEVVQIFKENAFIGNEDKVKVIKINVDQNQIRNIFQSDKIPDQNLCYTNSGQHNPKNEDTGIEIYKFRQVVWDNLRHNEEFDENEQALYDDIKPREPKKEEYLEDRILLLIEELDRILYQEDKLNLN